MWLGSLVALVFHSINLNHGKYVKHVICYPVHLSYFNAFNSLPVEITYTASANDCWIILNITEVMCIQRTLE